MRPPSIVMFERLFLASLVLSAVTFYVAYDAMIAEIDRQPAVRELGASGAIATGSMALGMAVYLLLWFLIARKASGVAKWILTVFTALGTLGQIYNLITGGFAFDLNTALAVGYYVLAIAAVAYLFKADAEAWLNGEPAA